MGCVGKVVAEEGHDEHLQGKEGDKGSPEFAAERDAGCGIGDGEDAGEHDTDAEAKRRLAAETSDVVDEPQRDEG